MILVAGPCSLETDQVNLQVAETLARINDLFGLAAIFKGSFDKANRTMLDSPRGLGLEEGLRALERVKSETGLRVTTDIHEPRHAAACADVVDVLQIPAFLSRQTDLLTAAGATGLPVNVKKGQWMAPEDVGAVAEKVTAAGAAHVLLTERGTSFGHGDTVVDMRSFGRMRTMCPGCTTLIDATHPAGDPVTLALAGIAAGADGLFIEVHPTPARATSDGARMSPLSELGGIVSAALEVRAAVAYLRNDS